MATNPKEYVNLRTLLDSLEMAALRYFLNRTGSQAEKFKYLNSKLRPIADELWKQAGQSDDCPPGFFRCDGMCVPYECPDLSNTAPTIDEQSAKLKKY